MTLYSIILIEYSTITVNEITRRPKIRHFQFAQISRWTCIKWRCRLNKLIIIENEGNKNIVETEKYTVKSDGVSRFLHFSNINIAECSQRGLRAIQRNKIMAESEFGGCLD
jgi:hypothetical protein